MQCPKCRTPLPDEANFCLKCGQPFKSKEKITTYEHIPDAERKRVTALFSDLSGYTFMTQKLDPEEVKKITSTIFSGVKTIISKYEGFIEKFAGDGVLALFGVPNRALIYKYKKQALLSGKKAINFSVKKNASDRIETFRLMGSYYFIINKKNKAISWWRKSVNQAEYMGYKLELSRTYYEIGRRTFKDRHKNTIICEKKTEEYLEGARNMFLEMNLQWDLNQMSEIDELF